MRLGITIAHMARARTYVTAAAALGALAATSCLVDFSKYAVNENPPNLCGNGQVDPREECDTAGATPECDDDCTRPGCGDGSYNPTVGEGCDDGNLEAGDSCDVDCQPTAFDIAEDIGDAEADAVLLRPSVGTTLIEGNRYFVVVWVERGAGKRQIAMKIYDGNGLVVQDKRVLSTTGDARCSAIASNQEGRSIVTWATENPRGSGQHSTQYVVIEPGGQPQPGGELTIPDSADSTYEGCPVVGAASGGEFCILWGPGDDGPETTYCLDESGNAAGDPQTLGESQFIVASNQRAIWGYRDGFMAQWFDRTSGELIGQELDSAGAAVGATFPISATNNPIWVGNGFSWDGGEKFVTGVGRTVDLPPDGEKTRFLYRRFNEPGSAEGSEDYITDDHENQNRGQLLGHPNGRFIAVWSSTGVAGATVGCHLRAREFDATGQPVDDFFEPLPGAPQKCGRYAAGAVTEDGDVMIVWTFWDTTGGAPYPPMRLQGIIFQDRLN